MRTVRLLLTLLLLMMFKLAMAGDLTNYSAAVTYVRCLAKTYDLQEAAKLELSRVKDPTSVLMTNVRMSTKAKLEMRAMIAEMNQLDVGEDAKPFVQNLSDFYRKKIDLNDSLIEVASKLLDGPKPGADYGKLLASTAEISGILEQIDEQIFKLANAFFAIMIDLRPDKSGHANHLKITRAQKAELLALIESRFGASIKGKNQNWTVGGAWLLRSNLQKGFKASDDPW